MSNIIISPQSGILEFNTGAASGSAFDGSLSGAARLKFESSGVLGLTSLGTGVTDKFTIDGSNGRLFTVNNTVTGSIFSVNDVAGLPIVEVFSDDRVVMGKYASDALVVSGSGVSFANVPTVSGNPIMTGVSSEDVDTLATVTARGATTSTDLTLNGNITVASSKHIGIGATLASIQFGDGSIGNETADVSFVTNSDGEFTFHRGANKLIMGTDHNFVDGEIFVNDGLRVGTTTHKGIGGNELVTISGGGASIPSQTWTNAHSSALYLRNYNNAAGEWQLQTYNGGNGGVIQLVPYGGNVTIGNLTASAKLDIKTDNGNAIRCESATGGHFIVTHGGKVGIQTHNPTYALHIDNNGNLNPANVLIDSTTTADASISFSHNGTFGYTMGTDETDGKLFKISSGSALGTNDRLTVNGVGLKVEGIVQADVLNTKANDGNIIYRSDSRTFVGNAGNNGLIVLDGGNVGIGRTDPNRDLSIVGQIGIDNSASSPSAGMLIAPDGTSNKIYSRTANNIATPHPLDFYAGSAHTLRIASDGNVGIGTTDPLGTTHIYTADAGGTIATNASHDDLIIENNGNCGIQLSSPATSYQYLAFGDTASANQGYVRYYHDNNSMTLRAGGTDILTLSGAKVGIGTAVPSDKLHVWGSVRGDLKLEGSYQGGATDVGKLTYAYTPRGGDHNNRTIASVSAYNTTTDSTAGGYLSITTRATDSTNQERIRVNQDGQVDIYGNASFAQYLYHKGDEDTNIKFNTDDVIINVGGATFFRATETTQNTIKLNSDSTDTDFYLYSSSSTPAIFMRGSDGQVGIGTNNPEELLHVKAADTVKGVIKVEGGKNTVSSVGEINSEIQFGSNDPSVGGDNIGGKISSVTENANGAWVGLGFYTYHQTVSDLAERMRITKEGNVGIGITNPTTKLVVNSVLEDEVALFESTDNDAYIHIKDNTDSVFIGHDAALDVMSLGFNSSMGVSSNLSIDTAGNVGIGTNNPTYQLDVVDSDGGTLARFKDSDSSHAGLLIQGDVNGGSITNNTAFTSEVIYLQNSANAMRFYTDGTEAVRIASSQRVGIGTNSVNGFTHINGRMLVEGPSVPSTLAISDSGDATKNLRLGYEPTWDVGSISASDFGAGWKNIVIAPIAGKVGIGTTAPHQALSVKGTIVSYNSSYVQVAGMTNSSNHGRLYANNSAGVTNVLLDSNGDSYLKGGDFGIGTDSPQTRLTVEDALHPLDVNRTDGSSALIQLRTQGSIRGYLGANGTDSLSVWNSTPSRLFTVRNGGNVGINVSDPDEKLEVAGKTHLGGRGQDGGAYIAYATLSETQGGAATILGNAVYAGTGSNVYRKTYNDAGNFIRMTYNQGICFHTNVTGNAASTEYPIAQHEQMRITTGGSVGIGTDAPTAQYDKTVHIEGENPTFRAETTYSAGWAYSQYVTPETTWSVGIDNHDKYIIANSATLNSNVKFVIDDANGNVGVGSTSPDAHLNIYNTGQTSSVADMHIVGSGNTYGLLVERLRNDSLIVSKSTTAGSYFKTDSATASFQGYEIGSNWFIGQYGYNDLRILDGSKSAGTAAITIQDSTQNIGIGTTDPATKLEVIGVTTSKGFRTRTDNGDFNLISRDNDLVALYIQNARNNTDQQIASFRCNSASAGAGTEIFRVAKDKSYFTNANVGVGTNSPISRLNIKSSATSSEDSALTITQNGGSNTIFAVGERATNGAQMLLFDGGTATHAFYTDGTDNYINTGSVGIGLTNPSDFSSSANRLVIGDGAGDEGMSIFAGASNSSSLYFADGAAGTAAYQGYVQYRHGDSRMDFAAAGGRRMIMNGNGLLIAPNGGVFSPSAELEIASSEATIRLTDSDLTNHYSEIEKAGVYTYFSSRANASDGGFLFFGSATDTEFMRITAAGNVGIGVSSDPSSKLHVNGELTASTKTFDIEHPTQSGKRLVHGCFEGPEHGVYFRGKTQDSGIQAPEYWSGLVDIDSMTVDVTPIGPNQSIYVDRVEDNGDVYVGANTEEPLNYFYIVYGERKDIDNLVIVKDAPVASHIH